MISVIDDAPAAGDHRTRLSNRLAIMHRTSTHLHSISRQITSTHTLTPLLRHQKSADARSIVDDVQISVGSCRGVASGRVGVDGLLRSVFKNFEI
jgi:hypothetical protein